MSWICAKLNLHTLQKMSFLESKATTSSDLLALSAGVDSNLALKLSTPSALPSENSVLTIKPIRKYNCEQRNCHRIGVIKWD